MYIAREILIALFILFVYCALTRSVYRDITVSRKAR